MEQVSGSRWRLWLAVIMVAAVAIRLVFSLGVQRHLNHVLPELESTDGYHLIATNWYMGYGYTYRAGDPPTMLRPPAYPAFLVSIFAVTGINYVWVQVVQAFLGAAACWILFLLGRWMLSVELGVAAAMLYAIYPNSILYSSRLYSENLYYPLFLGLAYVLCRASVEGSIWRGAAAGALWALGLLTRGTLLLLPLALPIGIALSAMHRRSVSQLLRWSIPAAIAALLTLSPWVLRNYALSSAFVPVSTWGWAPIYGGTQISKQMNDWSVDLSVADQNAVTALRSLTMRQLGRADDSQYNRGPSDELLHEKIAKAAVLSDWRATPLARLGQALEGLVYAWVLPLDPNKRLPSLLLHGSLLVLIAWGAITMARNYQDAFWRAWPALGMILFVNAFQAIAYPQVRYMSPAISLAFLFAALPLVALGLRFLKRPC